MDTYSVYTEYMVLHRWLHLQQQASEVSQEAIAEHLGLSQAQVSRLLNGHTKLRVDVFCQIAKCIGVDPADGLAAAMRPPRRRTRRAS